MRDAVKTSLRSLAFAFDGITGYVHGRTEGMLKHLGADMRFILPRIKNVRMTAAAQGLLIHYAASRSIDNKRIRLASGEKRFIAKVVGGVRG